MNQLFVRGCKLGVEQTNLGYRSRSACRFNVNYSNSPIRRVEFLVAVTYDNEVEKVRDVLVNLLSEHPMVLQEEGKMPVAHVKEFKDSDILYTARAWCENQNYWTLYFDIMDSIQSTFEKNGVSFTYPHVNVHMIEK